MSKNTPTVADFINHQINVSGKSQAMIAKEVGFERPNIISMIKLGATKLPIDKIIPMARALNIDRVFMMKLALEEYMPGFWDGISSLLEQPIITNNEIKLLLATRAINAIPSQDDLSEEKLEVAAQMVKASLET